MELGFTIRAIMSRVGFGGILYYSIARIRLTPKTLF